MLKKQLNFLKKENIDDILLILLEVECNLKK